MSRVDMNTHEASKFRALNRIVGATARDLDLLEAIDKTIAVLDLIKEQMSYHTNTVRGEIVRVRGYAKVIDEDGSIVKSLEETRDLLGSVHAKFVRKCESAKRSEELCEDDGVVEAYYDMLNAAADLHNAINSLCWAIGEHDADFDEPLPGGPYTSSDDLFAALGV